MKPVFEKARGNPKRVIFAEGEDRRVLRAVQVLLDDGVCMPTVIGNPSTITESAQDLGLRAVPGSDFNIVNPSDFAQFDSYAATCRKKLGISDDAAEKAIRTTPSVLACLMIDAGDADAMICGSMGPYYNHLKHVHKIVGRKEGVDELASLSVLIMPQRETVFICDTQATSNPTPQALCDMTLLAAEEIRRFGITPHVALLSHSNYGSAETGSANKMRDALALIQEADPDLKIDGEMQGDAALRKNIRERLNPETGFEGAANLLVMPSLDAANISYNLIKTLGTATSIGPILLGAAKPVHIVTTSATSRGIVNIAALAVVDAQN